MFIDWNVETIWTENKFFFKSAVWRCKKCKGNLKRGEMD
jgi:hypothetical protein